MNKQEKMRFLRGIIRGNNFDNLFKKYLPQDWEGLKVSVVQHCLDKIDLYDDIHSGTIQSLASKTAVFMKSEYLRRTTKGSNNPKDVFIVNPEEKDETGTLKYEGQSTTYNPNLSEDMVLNLRSRIRYICKKNPFIDFNTAYYLATTPSPGFTELAKETDKPVKTLERWKKIILDKKYWEGFNE